MGYVESSAFVKEDIARVIAEVAVGYLRDEGPLDDIIMQGPEDELYDRLKEVILGPVRKVG